MFSALIEKLGRRHDLTTDEAANVMAVIMRGEATSAQIAGLLIGLAMKGERPEELIGFARTMRAEAVQLTAPAGEVFDTCGTGGDRSAPHLAAGLTVERTSWRRELRAAAELFAATGFAITQPVLSVFGRSADVFINRDASSFDIVAFAILVAVVPTVGLCLVELVVGLVRQKARDAFVETGKAATF